MDLIYEFNHIINKITQNALRVDDPDEHLILSFTRLRQNIKEQKGTTPLIVSIAELLYFNYIRMYIEGNLIDMSDLKPREFRAEQIGSKNPNEQYYFYKNYKDLQVILASDLQLYKLGVQSKIRKKRPDIVIAIRKDDKTTPVALFEIKLNIDLEKFETGIILRFKEFLNDLRNHGYYNHPYIVCLLLESPVGEKWNTLISEFKNIDGALIMRKIQKGWNDNKKGWEGPIEGQIINEILEKIIQEIRVMANG